MLTVVRPRNRCCNICKFLVDRKARKLRHVLPEINEEEFTKKFGYYIGYGRGSFCRKFHTTLDCSHEFVVFKMKQQIEIAMCSVRDAILSVSGDKKDQLKEKASFPLAENQDRILSRNERKILMLCFTKVMNEDVPRAMFGALHAFGFLLAASIPRKEWCKFGVKVCRSPLCCER